VIVQVLLPQQHKPFLWLFLVPKI